MVMNSTLTAQTQAIPSEQASVSAAPLPTDQGRLPGLDGLRAISVFGVILSHLMMLDFFPDVHWLKAIALRGTYGVTVFFVLSGFLITHLLVSEERKTGRISLKRFYIRRGFRILPPALAYLAIVGIFGAFGYFALSWRDFLAPALFVENYQTGPKVVAHFWSLSVEEQFYLVWPVLVFLLPSRHRLAITLALVLLAPIWMAYSLQTAGGLYGVNEHRSDLVFHTLLAGCLLALARSDQRWSRFLSLPFCRRWPLFLISLVLILIRLSPTVMQGNAWLFALGDSLGAIGVALLVNVVIQARLPAINNLLNTRVLTWVGRLSYSLYLWQQPLCFARPTTWWLGGFPQCVIASIVFAAASYYLIEQPILGVRNRMFARGSRRAAQGLQLPVA